MTPETYQNMDAVRDDLLPAKKNGISVLNQNCYTVFLEDPMLKCAIRHNVLTDGIDIVRPVGWNRKSPAMNDTDRIYLLHYFEEFYGISNEKAINDAARLIAENWNYHPIKQYLSCLNWDGVERVQHALHHFLGAEENSFNYFCLMMFMQGALERVFHPGCKFEYMLCLTGGQGAGKSTFFRFLALKDEWFTDDARDLRDAKIYEKLRGHWIVELPEMQGTKDVEATKACVSKTSDTYRTPYSTAAEDRPRCCVFGGTTNKPDFMPSDKTGNRRFLPIQCHPEHAEQHILYDEKASRVYIEQMWAEVMEMRRTGNYFLNLPSDVEKHLRDYQSAFIQEDTVEGMIFDYLENYAGKKVCSMQLHHDALHRIYDPSRKETNEICDIINAGIANGDLKGWRAIKSTSRFPGYGIQKGWEKIPGCSESVLNLSK